MHYNYNVVDCHKNLVGPVLAGQNWSPTSWLLKLVRPDQLWPMGTTFGRQNRSGWISFGVTNTGVVHVENRILYRR